MNISSFNDETLKFQGSLITLEIHQYNTLYDLLNRFILVLYTLTFDYSLDRMLPSVQLPSLSSNLFISFQR